MKKTCSFFLAIIFALFFLSCGKKGELLPPLVRIPQTAKDIQITQKVDRIILTWKNPAAYEDGSPLTEIEKIEIWILKEAKGMEKETEKGDEEKEKEKEKVEKTEAPKIDMEEFDQKANLHSTIEKDKINEYLASGESNAGEMRFEYKLSPEDLGSEKITFGLRVKDRKRYSAFSDPVSLEPLVLSLPPEDVAASVFQDRIEVTWKSPSRNADNSAPANVKGFNIYRYEGEEKPRRLNESPVKKEKYEDKQFVFGQTYAYFVRASATESSPYLESEDSMKVEILAEDTFAPASPKGLISIAGQGFISLSWDINPEDDLDGYRVWRREEGEKEFALISREITKESAYIDKAVKGGHKYDYCVSALDKTGNESQKSDIISERVRESDP